jgi:excisionase family DNA binding protein
MEYLKPGSMPYAAAKLGVSLPIVYRLVKDGRLRTYRIGRAHRCSDQAIQDCIHTLEQQTRDTAA